MKAQNEYEFRLETVHPDTIQTPDRDQMVRGLKRGDFVEVCAEGEPGEYPAEQFWLEVDAIEHDSITGTIASAVQWHSLDRGDVLTVGAEHITGKAAPAGECRGERQPGRQLK